VTRPAGEPTGGPDRQQPASDGGPATDLDTAAALELLQLGTLDVQGRLVDASNATLYCGIELGGMSAACVYKPVRGERPLWDFPDGTLAGREVAAYLVSAATGWNVVPPTVLRDGPFGPGMVQLWIDGDESVDLAQLVRADDPALRRMAILDVVINNADRKGGHLIPMPGGHIYGVDHGVCFHVQNKLRTVLWGWAGQRLPADATEVLTGLCERLAAGRDTGRDRGTGGGTSGDLAGALADLVTPREVQATVRRIGRLLHTGRHPRPSGDWPPVPWPPF
jgi:uncharacterized repeat protein (TIGR03843 family)